MSDAVYATIELTSNKNEQKKMCREDFEIFDLMLKIEKENMKSDNDEKRSAIEEIMQGLTKIGYTEAEIKELTVQLQKEILALHNIGRDSDTLAGQEKQPQEPIN